MHDHHEATEVSVIGGGLAGLIAAVEVAEAGVPVRLHEARGRLGGRARSTPEPFVANLGPHALYTSTVLWDWLHRRGLHGPVRTPHDPRVAFRWHGAVRHTPPAALLRGLMLGRGPAAPVDEELRGWLTGRWGPDTAAAVSGLAGVLTFDHDPGRLSAAFVVERIHRILLQMRPTVRYLVGGWSALCERLSTHAADLGVVLELGAPVDAGRLVDLAARGPVVVAVEPGAARRLLGDGVAPDDGRRVALLDVGLTRRRRDPYLLMDLDRAVFSTRVTAVVPELAPPGHDLVQLCVGMAPGEDLKAAEHRLEAVLDAAVPGWRDREVWRRRAAVHQSSGAVDLPGSTWRDRPAVAHAEGIWLAGDWVAAPGHLAEVSATSAVRAAAEAVAAVSSRQLA